jgi:hypothetical protein
MTKREAAAAIFVKEILAANPTFWKAYLERDWPATQRHEIKSDPQSHRFIPDDPSQKELRSEFKGNGQDTTDEPLQ